MASQYNNHMRHKAKKPDEKVSALEVVALLVHVEAVFAIMLGLSVWLWPASLAMVISRGEDMWVTDEMMRWLAVYAARIDHEIVSGSVIVLAMLLILFGLVRYIMAYVVVGRMTHLYRHIFVVAAGLLVITIATYARNQTILSVALLVLDVCFVELLRRRVVALRQETVD